MMTGQETNKKEPPSADLLLAELKIFAESFWRNEETGEKRVNFFITLVTAVIAALVTLATSNLKKNVVHLITLFALFGVLCFGAIVLLRMIQRNKVTDEYKKAMDMIRSHFRTWEESTLREYYPFGKGVIFQIESTLKKHLDIDGNVPYDLRRKFEENSIYLSQNATVQKKRKKWLIIDSEIEQKYFIREENDKLIVFDRDKTRKVLTGGLVDMVSVVNSLVAAAILALLGLRYGTLIAALCAASGLVGVLIIQLTFARSRYDKKRRYEKR